MNRTIDTYDHIARTLFNRWLNFNDHYAGETKRQDIWNRMMMMLEKLEQLERLTSDVPFIYGPNKMIQNLDHLVPVDKDGKPLEVI